MSAGLDVTAAVHGQAEGKERGWREPLQPWLDRWPFRGFVVLTVLYVIATVVLSSFKLLWLDEMITLLVARLGSVGAIWHALANGADPNPPMIHLLVHACRSIFGEHEIVLRMPAIAGYWVGMLSLFLYLRRYLSGTWALAGTLMSIATGAFDYSFESRSYAVFYGLAMLAFLAWSRAVETGVSRRVGLGWLGLMVVALAAGISTNYFAVLAFFPIAVGELVRLAEAARRGVWRSSVPSSIRVWVGMAYAATPLLAFRSMIAHSIAQFAPYAWNKVSLLQVSDSYTQMVEYILYPILAVLLLAGCVRVWSRFTSRLCQSCRATMFPRWAGGLGSHAPFSRPLLPLHESAGVLMLMAYPLLGYLVASFRGGMLSPRFVIPVCFGFAIAGTVATFRVFGHLRFAGVFLLGLCGAWFLSRESVVGYWYVEQKQSFYKILDHLAEAEAGLGPETPIVIPEPLLALTFQHYAPPAIAGRVVFPVDFPAIRLYRRDDSPEENIWSGRATLYTLPIMTLAEFQPRAGKYLIVGYDGNWLIEDLKRHRYPVERLAINTRAGSIGGFTPLDRGVPVFFIGSGDAGGRGSEPRGEAPIPFRVAANLPEAPLSAAEAP